MAVKLRHRRLHLLWLSRQCFILFTIVSVDRVLDLGAHIVGGIVRLLSLLPAFKFWVDFPGFGTGRVGHFRRDVIVLAHALLAGWQSIQIFSLGKWDLLGDQFFLAEKKCVLRPRSIVRSCQYGFVVPSGV